MSRRRFDRRPAGFVLLIVLALLAVSTVLVANAARILILENRHAERSEDRQQAQWLAESALERAAARLLADRDYRGETWRLSAADLGRPAIAEGSVGSAVIKIDAVADRPNARRVQVTADFPVGAAESNAMTNRVSKQIVFELADGKTPAAGEAQPAEKASNPLQQSNSTFVAENQP